MPEVKTRLPNLKAVAFDVSSKKLKVKSAIFINASLVKGDKIQVRKVSSMLRMRKAEKFVIKVRGLESGEMRGN